MAINNALPGSELREHLARMVLDGLLADGLEPRPHPREPIPIFIAKGGRN
jgi:hypothetical protein